jgi:EmrB/QacA subfamily drug resistance transporter
LSSVQTGGWSRAFALLVALTGFLELFDGTVIQTALPAMARDFTVSPGEVAVSMAAYFAAVSAAIPLCSWLANRFGVRNSFVAGVLLFVVGSVLCGFTSTLPALLVDRIVQGVGGAVMMTIGQMTVIRTAPREKMLNVTAYLVWPALIAPVVAPVIGGLVTDSFGWRWLFWINVPLGIAGALLGLRLAPKSLPGADPKQKLDYVGAILLSLGLWALISALGAENVGFGASRILELLLGIGFTIAAVVWLLKAKKPLLDLRLYRLTSFRITNFGGAIYRSVIITVPVLVTLLFQEGFGWSAVQSGAVVTAIFIGNIGIKPAANWAIRRWGFRSVLMGATIGGVVGLIGIVFIGSNSQIWLIVLILAVSGAARSVGFTSYVGIQFADVPQDKMSVASPLSGTVQQLSAAAGIAVFVGIGTWLQSLMEPALALKFALSIMAFVLAATLYWLFRLPRETGARLAVK